MVKKRVTARQKVQAKQSKQEGTAVSKSNGASTASKPDSADGQLEFLLESTGSSGREKRHLIKQMRFLKKLQATEAALSAKKSIVKKKNKRNSTDLQSALRDLSSLGEFLPSFAKPVEEEASRKSKILRSAAMQKITKTETKQLAAVLLHPAFKQNPFEAIHQHLENTLPPPAPPIAASSAKKKKTKKKKKSQEGNDMDIIG